VQGVTSDKAARCEGSSSERVPIEIMRERVSICAEICDFRAVKAEVWLLGIWGLKAYELARVGARREPGV
jgi:hypothetical protein